MCAGGPWGLRTEVSVWIRLQPRPLLALLLGAVTPSAHLSLLGAGPLSTSSRCEEAHARSPLLLRKRRAASPAGQSVVSLGQRGPAPALVVSGERGQGTGRLEPHLTAHGERVPPQLSCTPAPTAGDGMSDHAGTPSTATWPGHSRIRGRGPGSWHSRLGCLAMLGPHIGASAPAPC